MVLDGGSETGSNRNRTSLPGKGLREHKVVRRGVWKYREDLDCLIQMAARHSADWIVYNDADEFLEPRQPGQTLYEAIVTEDRLGFNIIRFDHFLFLSDGVGLREQQDLTSERNCASTHGMMITDTKLGNITQGRHFATAEDTIRFFPRDQTQREPEGICHETLHLGPLSKLSARFSSKDCRGMPRGACHSLAFSATIVSNKTRNPSCTIPGCSPCTTEQVGGTWPKEWLSGPGRSLPHKNPFSGDGHISVTGRNGG